MVSENAAYSLLSKPLPTFANELMQDFQNEKKCSYLIGWYLLVSICLQEPEGWMALLVRCCLQEFESVISERRIQRNGVKSKNLDETHKGEEIELDFKDMLEESGDTGPTKVDGELRRATYMGSTFTLNRKTCVDLNFVKFKLK